MTNDDNCTNDSIDLNLNIPNGLDETAERILIEATSILTEYTTSMSDISQRLNTRNPQTREEAHFTSREEDILYDAWQVLRAHGANMDDIEGLTRVITAETIYTEDALQTYYEEFVAPEFSE